MKKGLDKVLYELYNSYMIIRKDASEVRQHLAETLQGVALSGERVLVERRGQRLAALVSVQDLALLEQWQLVKRISETDREAAVIAERLFGFIAEMNGIWLPERITHGAGERLWANYRDGGTDHRLLEIWSTGAVHVPFHDLSKTAAFEATAVRKELLDLLRTCTSSPLSDSKINGYVTSSDGLTLQTLKDARRFKCLQSYLRAAQKRAHEWASGSAT